MCSICRTEQLFHLCIGKMLVVIRVLVDVVHSKHNDHDFARDTIICRLQSLAQSRGEVEVIWENPYNSMEVFLLVPGPFAIALYYTAIMFPGILAGLGVLEWNLVGSLEIFDLRLKPDAIQDKTRVQEEVKQLLITLYAHLGIGAPEPKQNTAQAELKVLVETHGHDDTFMDVLASFIISGRTHNISVSTRI
eukprot:scpid104470/ scgid0630/ 